MDSEDIKKLEDITTRLIASSAKPTNHKKPQGWSEKSTSSYYAPRFAEEIKPHLDLMLSDEKKEITFSAITLGLGRASTIYVRLAQGWRYLIEHMDPDGKYKELRKHVSIRRKRNLVKLSRQPSRVPILVGDITNVDEDSEWRKELVDYVTNSRDMSKSIERSHLDLSEEDIDWLIGYLGSLDEIVATIRLTKTGYKIVKNAALAKKIKAERLAKLQHK